MRSKSQIVNTITKRLVLLALMLLAFANYSYAQLIISQYVETNSGTAPKGIEIMNVSGNSIDFAQNNLTINQYSNGSATATFIMTISSGKILDGQVFVIGTSDIKTYLDANNLSHVPFYSFSFLFNGDDAVELKLAGNTVDVFGTKGSDPGSSWPTAATTYDQVLVKTMNSNVQRKAGNWVARTSGFSDPKDDWEYANNPTGSSPLVTLGGFGIPVSGYVASSESPTRLAVKSVSPATPWKNLDFKVTVIGEDNLGNQRAADKDYTINLSKINGIGNLTGNTTVTFPKGEYETSFTLRYSEIGVIEVKVAENTNTLTGVAKQSLRFVEGPKRLAFDYVFPKGHIGASHPTFKVLVLDANGLVSTNYNNIDITINVVNAAGTLSNNTVKAVNGIATFSNLIFNNAGDYVISAYGSGLTNQINEKVSIMNVPSMTDVLIPRYMSGVRRAEGFNNFGERIPAYSLVKITNLHPNTTYRYINSGSDVKFAESDPLLQASNFFQRGNMFFTDGREDWYYGNFGVLDWKAATSDCFPKYSTLTSDQNGEANVWLSLIPVNVDMYEPSRNSAVYWTVSLGFENGNFIRRMQTTQSTSPIVFDVNDNSIYDEKSATGVYGLNSIADNGRYIALYSMNEPSVQPISIARVENDNINFQSIQYNGSTSEPCDYTWFTNEGPAYYANIDKNVDLFGNTLNEASSYSWATLIPDVLSDGSQSSINYISILDNNGNDLYSTASSSGVWNNTNTNSPNGSLYAPLELDIPLIQIAYPTNETSICNYDGNLYLFLYTRGVENVNVSIFVNGQLQKMIENAKLEQYENTEWMYIDIPLARGTYNNKNVFFLVEDASNSDVYAVTNQMLVLDAPMVDSKSESATYCEGETANLAVTADGNILAYQWYKDGKAIEGATTPALQIQNLTYEQSGVYTLGMMGNPECGYNFTKEIVVYVLRGTEITRQPKNAGTELNGKAILSFDAHTNGAPPTYREKIQWYRGIGANAVALKDNNQFIGTNSNYLGITRVDNSILKGENQFWARIEGQCGADSTRVVKVVEGGIEFVHIRYNNIYCFGAGSAVLDVNARAKNSDDKLQYQWYFGTKALTDDANISGSKSSVLTIKVPTRADLGKYHCVLTIKGADYEYITPEMQVIIFDTPVVTKQPEENVAVEEGKTLTLTVEAQEAESYRWTRNANEITGANTATLTIDNVDALDAGEYVCEVINPCGSVFTVASNVSITQASTNTTSVENPSEYAGNKLFVSNPNPVSTSSIITFELSKSGSAKLSLLDATGQEIALLANKYFDAGVHSIEIDAEKLSLTSGTYHYTLNINGITITNKLVVVK